MQTISEIMSKNCDENPFVCLISDKSNLAHYGRYNRLPPELQDASVIEWWVESENNDVKYYFVVPNLGSLER